MRFKVAENLPVEVAAILTGAGHDADTVFDESLCGAADQKIAAACLAEGRILVTMDLDFADIRAFPTAELPGAMVFSLWRPPAVWQLFGGRFKMYTDAASL